MWCSWASPTRRCCRPKGERLRELAEEGVLGAAYLSAARSEAWLVIRGDGPDAVTEVVASLPLAPYMERRGIVAVRGLGPSAGDAPAA